MASSANGPGPADGLGWYRGARYSRTWFTTLAGLPLLCTVAFSFLLGSPAWTVLVPLTVVVVATLWLVPQSIVTASHVRLVLRRETIPWSAVRTVLDPRPGDEEARIELTTGRVLTVPGVSCAAVPALRRTLQAAGR
jgi:hypothetical protein